MTTNSKRAIIEFDVAMPARDGTILRAEVLRPDTDEPVHVILMRNPYPPQAARQQLDQLRAVASGFAIVAQSCRGTGASDGTFEPWVMEASDGVDAIEWCAQQPWSSGRVAMLGGSYLAHTQLYAAGEAPPALAAIAPSIAPSGPYALTYNGGALCMASLGWALGMAFMKLMRNAAAGQDVMADFAELGPLMAMPFDQLCRTAPLRDLRTLHRVFPAFEQWLDHPTKDEWWQNVDVPDRAQIPSIYIAGWWDIFGPDSLREFNRSRHPKSRLVVGPWSHRLFGAAHGAVHYGASADQGANDLIGMQLNFLGDHLNGDDGPAVDKPVRLFIMGANVWRDEAEWPLARAQSTRYYLQPDGGLSATEPSAVTEPKTFVFDPLQPVPTLGGRNLMSGGEGSHLTGPWDHALHDSRTDILRFTSAPLDNDLEVTGTVTASIVASTTAVDTDWTAMLLDVWPDGRAFNVVEGIIRARHHLGTDRTAFVAPGTPTRFEIDLSATAQVFKAGHRLRLDVSSSNFPRYDRNPGNGGLSSNTPEQDFVPANQTVFLDAGHASYITLPIIPA